jgi:hypothetical protein
MISVLGALALAAAVCAAPAPAQQQSPQEKERPKRAKRVWTNDDVKELRTPADEYLRQREAAAQPQPEGAATPEKPAPEEQGDGINDYVPPKTVEEAEVRVADKRNEIRHTIEAIRIVREEYFAETDDQKRGTLRAKIERMARDQAAAEKELERLEASLAELRSGTTPAAQKEPVPPQP